MEAFLRREEVKAKLTYDRQSRKLTGASIVDRVAICALQAGSVLTWPFGHRGYGFGCDFVSVAVAERDIIVRLNHDAAFAIPFCDRYWSKLLNSRFDYEEEIEAFLKNVIDLKYTFVDCGANFGYWSILASSQPFGAQTVVAIEASPRNAARLVLNARLNGDRFRCINAAISGRAGEFMRIAGHRHEAFSAVALEKEEQGAVKSLSLDSLVDGNDFNADTPTVVKLDVEGVEIEAIKGGARLLAGNAVLICEDHGSDRTHSISRYLLKETPLRLYLFDPEVRRFLRVEGPEVLDRVKRHRWVGYNVFATKSPLWEMRLLSTRWTYR